MGENEGWAELGEPLPNGLLPGSGSVMRALDADRWVKAEDRTAELIACIQPNQLSEGRRNAVADYVQRLIMKCFPCQVCTFGSVPLKTYLPDGDIDLTACSQNQNLKDSWANQVRDMLEKEEKNENAEFHVKEVQYIQAEVKIIKCLVENIVVDISFNQVGGLCTLCFLDEVDNLINQNHLFKRSIILIKAWCYYESRILGAHHGLISTYALETLVLYIFHVFNNSFHGPLEVLYRFLEFFSNFDWDNFCVSLWGPVPISSLPDITAEPPRKDGGRLLLSKLFLDVCSSVYAVFPAGQENNGMPFVSKYFNVIDPLRVNNNLGRSVSKGNFFRIRSAFAFGAKRLARLLDCPKENLIYEVNQFFMNTWDRHGSGNRPDAPRLSTPKIPHEHRNSNNNGSGKKVKEESAASSRVKPITSELSVASRTHDLKYQFNVNSLRLSDQIGGDPVSGQVEINDMIRRDLKADKLIDETQGRLLLARTRSSPELTESYTRASSQLQHNRQAVAAEAHATYPRLDSSNRRKNPGSESLGVVEENSSGRNVASQQILGVADLGIDALSEEFLTTSAAQIMQQEEQDLVNIMASASLQGFNGQVHVPFNLTSGHLPYSIPPDVLASMGYSLRNMPGLVPTNIQLMDPSLSHLQFPHGLVSPHLPHYFHGIGVNPSEDSIDRNSEFFSHVEINSVEADNDYLQEQDACFDPENGNFETLQSEMKYVPPPSQVSGSHSGRRVQQKHLKEKRGVMKENVDSYPVQDIMSSEIHVQERSRFSSASHSTALRSRTSSESSWDGLSVKAPRSAKEKRGKKSLSTDLTVNHGKGKFMSENVSIDTDNDDQECVSLLNVGTEVQVPRHHMPGFEAAHTSGSDSMIPFAPMLINPGSRQRTGDNSGLIAFYPTGPPIPFLTMLPVYNMPPETATCDETCDQSEDRNTSSSFIKGTSIVETSEEQKPDILNSDFVSHWQNLQFGRVCQNPRYQGPVVYSSPFMVPPAYVQGQLPRDSPSRPLSANANLYSQLVTNYGNHVVPIAPSNRHLNVYQSYNHDLPRFRSGTGTYLPNPKVPVRERHSSSGRRGNYNHDRNDSFGDRSDNWTGNSKSRASGRSHNRSHTDKSNSRTDRFNNNEGRGDRLWNNSNRHNPIPSHQSQSGPLPSNSNQIGPQNVAYSMYNLGATNPTGVSNGPPLVMLYHPFDHNPNYGSHSEQLEFGSLGPVGFPGINEQSHITDGTRARALEEHRFHGSSGHRTPDHPSSPQNQRRL